MILYPIHCIGMDIDFEHEDLGCFFYWIGMDIDNVTRDFLYCFGL
jgi:hypothetical protein